ncbi:uncharacterized protein TRAVEDRAFT_60908 [Trametes versicolor FP-101664 SS1]|uniref:uncharacterized protein n=1 Tax=Trametes versicolor (strain FP-101664) TaxID=717944 RepID=UPI0004622F5D|nr:uncharacterized protein TRAVEDRAFT_60908 [Trametes versicolor FP-101664 SS1]EIW53479.1 hypothetical protein TRAVEDRAFT_60908 [Trametes versicolor FP-101664 SS1]
MSKVVFVGNVPYNMGEDSLIDVFKSVGQVVGLRLVFDRETGKPKGYGFCEFADHETALSAVRNLNGQEIGGRPLRIDLADSDPFLEGKTTVRGEIIDGGETRAQWRERHGHERDRHDRHDRDDSRHGRGPDPNAFLASLPKGVPLTPNQNALDAISQVLASTEPTQILEVLAQMKAFVITHPEQARALLVAHPQLGYALFQALLLHKIVDPAILNRMLAATGAAPPTPVPAPPPPQPQVQQPAPYMPPPVAMQQPPPMYPQAIPPPSQTPVHHPTPPIPNMYAQPPPQMQPPPYYRPPPPAAPPSIPQQYQQQPGPPQMPGQHPMQMPPPSALHAPPQVPLAQQTAAVPEFDQTQRDMLMQVLRLTADQLNTLPPTEREQIMQLRRQFGVGA